ncbi:methyl-accepting chemotaxis protein [Azoarcus olearius]|uniref:Aerotaxis receptor protein n=1 Tax=Azoarcus sp. (strain BH72) TaxID=418699 RepID=A1K582_AZOSB|nr:methyl-accepting chemotaxis protein [Azoarcus olearius]CAL93987.1 putative aerotaxis receptor protein [Azoarcus olearius]
MIDNKSATTREHAFPRGKLVVLKYDMDFKITYANEACAEMVGSTREALIGSSIKEIAHPDVPQELLADVRGTTSSGRPWLGLSKLKHRDGGVAWSTALTIPVRQNGRNVGFMSLRSEAPRERVQAEEALYEAMRRKQARYRNLDMPVRRALSSAAMLCALGGLGSSLALLLVFAGLALDAGAWAYALIAAGGLGLAGMLALVATLWRRSITESATMLKAFERIAEGDLTSTLPVGRSDEMGRLMESLMYMQGRLKVMLDEIRLAAALTDKENAALRAEVQSLKDAADAQRDRILSVSAASEQNSAAVAEVAGGAKASAQAANEALALVAEGRAHLNQTVGAARRTVDAVEGANRAMRALGDSIQSVATISAEIREISDQTNLLALNAAIEAARAGEVGRGFAVVADEVRKLAERTAHCTGNIASMVGEIRRVSDEVAGDMDKAAGLVGEASGSAGDSLGIMGRIEQGSGRVAGLAGHIADASAEHSTASEQIAQDMELISGLVERSAAGIDAVDRAADGVQCNVGNLKQLVGFFRVVA